MSTLAYPTRAVWEIAPEVEARDRGLKLAASAHYRDLALAREIARELGRDGRVVCADDVRSAMSERFPDTVYGNWMGGLFRDEEWEWVRYVTSVTKGGHGNRIGAWRLR